MKLIKIDEDWINPELITSVTKSLTEPGPRTIISLGGDDVNVAGSPDRVARLIQLAVEKL